MSQGGGEKESAPTPYPSPPRATRVGREGNISRGLRGHQSGARPHYRLEPNGSLGVESLSIAPAPAPLRLKNNPSSRQTWSSQPPNSRPLSRSSPAFSF